MKRGVDVATNWQVQVGVEKSKKNLLPEAAAAGDWSAERGISRLGSFPGIDGQSHGM